MTYAFQSWRWHGIQGAEILALPAAWVGGPLKEHHWSTLLAAHTHWIHLLYGQGECGNKNIGQSRIIDPFGVTIAAASRNACTHYGGSDAERVRQVRATTIFQNNRHFVHHAGMFFLGT